MGFLSCAVLRNLRFVPNRLQKGFLALHQRKEAVHTVTPDHTAVVGHRLIDASKLSGEDTLMPNEDRVNQKILVAFDFDHTIIDDNSDIHVTKLAPNGNIPQDIQDKFKPTGWTHYMAAIFRFLHENSISRAEILQSMKDLPLTEGMKELLTYLDKDIFEVIIISDSNSVFIDYILECVQLKHVIKKVYTNPAHFNEEGCLEIDFYHTQDWCDLSTENLCKGHILEDHINEDKSGTKYSPVVYVGDGANDLCPALRLSEQDYVCARNKFTLWKKMKSLGHLDGEASEIEMKANPLVWDSGLEVLELVKTLEKERSVSVQAKI